MQIKTVPDRTYQIRRRNIFDFKFVTYLICLVVTKGHTYLKNLQFCLSMRDPRLPPSIKELKPKKIIPNSG